MKKCPHCAAINQEYDPVCGMCGESLSGVASKDLVSLDVEPAKTPMTLTFRREIRPKGVVALAIGLASISAGLYLLFDLGFIGLILLFVGVPTVAYALGVSESPVLAAGVRAKSLDTRRQELEESREGERPEKGETD